MDLGRPSRIYPLGPAEEGTRACTKRCIEHIGCRNGEGKLYHFQGKWQDDAYILTVYSNGLAPDVHQGDLTPARVRNRHSEKLPLTRLHRRRIRQKHSAMCSHSSTGAPTPLQVAVELGQPVMNKVPASSFRKVLRRGSLKLRRYRQGKSRHRGTVPWTSELASHFDDRQDPDTGSICVIQRSLGTMVTSFIVLAPPFFAELQKLFQSGVISNVLVGAADVCFNVEWQGYTFNEIIVQFHRCLQGRWRKTAWFGCYVGLHVCGV